MTLKDLVANNEADLAALATVDQVQNMRLMKRMIELLRDECDRRLDSQPQICESDLRKDFRFILGERAACYRMLKILEDAKTAWAKAGT